MRPGLRLTFRGFPFSPPGGKLLLFRHVLALAVSTWGLSACEVLEDHHGFVMAPNQKQLLQEGVGRISQETILEKLGQPTYIFSFDPWTWYYLGIVVEREVFFYPHIKGTPCYALHINPTTHILEGLEISSGPQIITPASQETPLPSSHGTKLLQQIFHKFGKFPSSGSSTEAVPSPHDA